MRRTVLQLVGSPVDEFHADLSRLYAGACLDALAEDDRYDQRVAYVSPDGSWRFTDDLAAESLASAAPMTLAEAIGHLHSAPVDVVIPQMFCLPGMTAYRALFDVLKIPYLGNSPEVMAIAADKAKARAIVAAAGVAVPAGEVVTAGMSPSLALPVVVKPVDADNSAGVTLVREMAQLDAAVELACSHGRAALVESYVELGREVRCGIVVRGGELVCLPLEEYAVSAAKPVRLGDDKLDRSAGGDLYLVAKDPTRAWIVPQDDPITERVWAAARACHVAMGCRHYSLFDFRIDPDGNPWFLEAGPYCSFAPTSVIAVMAAAAGVGVAELFATTLSELDEEGAPCLSSLR
ncbi:D-alanine--D-alanine ligase [Mycobacterium sp. NPDC006124]|uniref:D-alanine--D-alanine ligase n=1 Tax=Mycobacterium sp. NPDC006124 TaxID=3156729 RepID=UPI0033BD7686